MVAKPNQALGSQSEFLPIPSGYVALTIPTSEQQGVAGNIQPDDYISVIATVTTGRQGRDQDGFHQPARDPSRHGYGHRSGARRRRPSSLTVVVTECQAEYITWFLTYASLKYTLESYQDYLQAAAGQGSDLPERHLGDRRHPADGAEGLPEPLLGRHG